MLSLDWIKVIILVTLLVLTFTFSMIPLKVVKFVNSSQNYERRICYRSTLSLMSCFAAGVFLATCLLDLFPDVRDILSTSVARAGVITTYPLSEFVLAFGLFLVFIIEQIVLHSKELSGLPQQADSRQDRQVCAQDQPYHRLGDPDHQYRSNSLLDSENESEGQDCRGGGEEGEEDHRSLQGSIAEDPNSHSSVRSLILVTALSMHSVFEGLAVGLQTNYEKVLQIFAAITLHKSILAFSLGLNLAQSRLSLRGVIQSNLAFSVTSPIGIGIGLAVVELAPANYITGLINGILQGLACGTFLYVVFLEILPSEFMGQHSPADRMLRTLSFILGFSTVALLLLLEPGVVRPKLNDT